MSLEIGLRKTKRIFFIVESPLQLLSALEAIFLLKPYNYLLIVRYSEQRNNRQLTKIIQDLDVDTRYIKFVHFDSQINIKNSYKIFKFMLWMVIKKREVKEIYLGDYNSKILTLLRKYVFNKNKIYYLDDGVATLNIQKNFSKDNFYHLFTMYNLPPLDKQKITQHHFLYLKNYFKMDTLEKETVVLLLGNKFYEEKLISKEYFFQSLEQLLSFYPDQKIRYIAHRDEETEKLKYLEQYYGFDVVQYDYPIELYGLYEKKIPSEIVSFLSTALLTMKMIYVDVNVTAYRINLNELLDRKEGFSNIYKVYENYLDVKDL